MTCGRIRGRGLCFERPAAEGCGVGVGAGAAGRAGSLATGRDHAAMVAKRDRTVVVAGDFAVAEVARLPFLQQLGRPAVQQRAAPRTQTRVQGLAQ